MAERRVIQIAACRPVDTSGLPDAPGLAIPPPMQDDTIQRCDQCGQDIWVAPRKRFLASLGHAELLCYLCAIAAMVGATVTLVDLDPDRVERPRV